jgi:hypothetical protein
MVESSHSLRYGSQFQSGVRRVDQPFLVDEEKATMEGGFYSVGAFLYIELVLFGG